jgi:hydroxymethylglutaryl-CoA lyase
MANNVKQLKLTECPRDAMQGWEHNISTITKVNYLNALYKVGFFALDAGSFVSPKAIPQMADTAEVFAQIETANNQNTICIFANERGLMQAADNIKVNTLGFPLSLSETFQLKNTNKTIAEALSFLAVASKTCKTYNKQLVVYLSMAFGNPYGDEYNEDIINKLTEHLIKLNITQIRLADTVGLATPKEVFNTTNNFLSTYKEVDLTLHLHASKEQVISKLEAGLQAGCYSYDVAIGGIGGCPLSGSNLVGNMHTELVVEYAQKNNMETGLNREAFNKAVLLSKNVFI